MPIPDPKVNQEPEQLGLNFTIPKDPVYTALIPRLSNENRANASNVLNPQTQILVNNTHALKLRIDRLEQETSNGGESHDHHNKPVLDALSGNKGGVLSYEGKDLATATALQEAATAPLSNAELNDLINLAIQAGGI